MYFKDKKTKLSLQNMFGYGAARGGGKPNFFQKKKARRNGTTLESAPTQLQDIR